VSLALLVTLQLGLGQAAVAPAPPERPSLPDLEAWNRHRQDTNRLGMVVLGSWALGNLVVGTVGALATDDPRWRAFHVGNAAWNVVNLVIAGLSYFGEHAADPRRFDAAQSLDKAQGMEKALLLNLGLDVAYLAAGAFLWQRGEAGTPELVGLGQALLVQGGFLLAFDAILYVLNAALTADLLKGLSISHGAVRF
jgi:hypothetical protein